MNKETAKDYLPLLQALAEGKVLQYKHMGDWADTSVCDFYHPASSYRIKPEPREFTVWIGHESGYITGVDMTADGWEKITVREVLQ